MKNPFKNFFKPKGLPDSVVHHPNPYQTDNALVFPLPLTAGDGVQSSVVDAPIAYSYAAQQAEVEAEASWEFNAGNNVNKKGHQKIGKIVVGNTSNAGVSPINLPRNGRFVFKAGGNTNEGDWQQVGSIEFANVCR